MDINTVAIGIGISVLFMSVLVLWQYRRRIAGNIRRGIRIEVERGQVRLQVPKMKKIYKLLMGPREYERQRRKLEGKLLVLEPLVDEVRDVLQRKSEDQAAEEPVYFSGFYPKAAPVGKWELFVCYMHTKSAVPAMRKDVIMFINDVDHQIPPLVSHKEAWLKFGTKVTLVPKAPDVVFNPPVIDIWWSDDLNRAHFYVNGTRGALNRKIQGELCAYVGLVQVAQMPFTMVFVDEKNPLKLTFQDYNITHAKMYRNIYASFASDDSEALHHLLKALVATADDGLVRSILHRDMIDWVKQSRELIAAAESFQLFWSAHSARCPVVRKEWELAKAIEAEKETQFVRPIYWETPFPVPPKELPAHDFYFAPINE